jgi:hypothetical protein
MKVSKGTPASFAANAHRIVVNAVLLIANERKMAIPERRCRRKTVLSGPTINGGNFGPFKGSVIVAL